MELRARRPRASSPLATPSSARARRRPRARAGGRGRTTRSARRPLRDAWASAVMLVSTSRPRRLLPIPGGPDTVTTTGVLCVDAALVGGEDLRELGFAPEERRTARALAASPLEPAGRPPPTSVAAHLKFESPAREFAGGGVGEHFDASAPCASPAARSTTSPTGRVRSTLLRPVATPTLPPFVGQNTSPARARALPLRRARVARRGGRPRASWPRATASAPRASSCSTILARAFAACPCAAPRSTSTGGSLGARRLPGRDGTRAAGARRARTADASAVDALTARRPPSAPRRGGPRASVASMRADQVIERRGHQGHELRKARRLGGHQTRQGGDGGRPTWGGRPATSSKSVAPSE